MDLFGAFRRNREEHPDEPAFLIASGDRSVPISWRQFTDDIAVVSWLIGEHVPRGTIGVIGENSYEWMVAHAACLFSGATVVPLDVNLTADEIRERLQFVGASMLVHSSLYTEKAREAARKMPGLSTGGFGTRKTDLALAAGRKAIRSGFRTIWDRGALTEPGQTSMIVFTSGTTSEPRGAELTVAGLEAFADAAEVSLKMDFGDRSLMVLPLHHIFGIAVAYATLSRGVALGVCPDFRRLFDAVERFRADFLFLVPALAEILAAKIEQRGESAEAALGSPIRWVLTGGAPLSRRTYERLKALGVKTISAYGLTETTALYSIDSCTGEARVGSAGRRAKLAAVEVKVSKSGELLVRGPNVMKGYYKMPERTAGAIDRYGWFHTGDIGRIDAKGHVWVTGRVSRTIVLSSGKKIAPEELEAKLLMIPGIDEAVVTGDGETREVIAEVYGRASRPAIEKAVGALNLLLPVYKRVSTVVVREKPFPRTSSGKISYAKRKRAAR